jgi:phage-related baseplate assembly protein
MALSPTTVTFNLDDLVTPLSRQEVQKAIYDVLSALGVNTTSWKPGAVVRTIIVGCSSVIAGLSTLQAQIARAGFLELSSGVWLTALAHYVYGIDRIEATFATGEVTLTNTAGGIYSLGTEDFTVKSPVTGQTYKNTEAFDLGPAGGGHDTVTIPIRATEPGAAGSAAAASITSLVTTLDGVTCSNASPLTSVDGEDDVSLKRRCSEMLGALSPMGPWDAYAAAVRNATRDDGSPLGITRMRITKDGYGNVTVHVAGASGAVSDPDDIDVALEAIEQNAVPLCVTPHVESATAKPVPVTYEVWMYNTSGRSEAQITDTIASRITALINGQPIGGNTAGALASRLFVDSLRTTIGSALPEIFHVAVTSPADDVILQPYEVPVLSGAPVVTAIHQVAPPEGLST